MAQRAARRHRSATRPRGRDPRRSHRHPPPGFGPATVANTGPVGTRLQLGIEATTETACGWIDTWLTATASRDQETKAAATAALAESRQWKFLVDNPVNGGERRSETTWTQPTTAKSSENPHPWTSPSQTRLQLHRLSDAPIGGSRLSGRVLDLVWDCLRSVHTDVFSKRIVGGKQLGR